MERQLIMLKCFEKGNLEQIAEALSSLFDKTITEKMIEKVEPCLISLAIDMGANTFAEIMDTGQKFCYVGSGSLVASASTSINIKLGTLTVSKPTVDTVPETNLTMIFNDITYTSLDTLYFSFIGYKVVLKDHRNRVLQADHVADNPSA